MTSIQEVVKGLVKSHSFIEVAINQDLINFSSLARQLKPKIEQQLFKKVTIGAIVMALKRLAPQLKTNLLDPDLSLLVQEITVRSSLSEHTFSNSEDLMHKHIKFLDEISKDSNTFLTLCEGTFETTIITSSSANKYVDKIFASEKKTMQRDNLTAINLKLDKNVINLPGFHYKIFKILTWENINIVESVSTYTELTLIIDSLDTEKAFSVISRAVMKR